jgi:hypothetical protein
VYCTALSERSEGSNEQLLSCSARAAEHKSDDSDDATLVPSTRERGEPVLTGIVVDALDVALMEEFWSEATEGRTHGLSLRFEATTKPKEGKNRLHLDLAGGAEWAAEVERLLGLGATRTDIGQGDVPWDVLADPEGNEFCVVRPGHHGVRAERGLATICLDVAEEDRAGQSVFWQAESMWPVVQHGDGWTRLWRSTGSRVSLIMGPPAAPKLGRNRLRLEVTHEDWETGEFRDAGCNEFHVTRPAPSGTLPAR